MSNKDLIPHPPVHRRWWRTIAGTLWIAGAAANHKNLKHLDPYHVRIGEAIVLLGGTCLILSGLRQVPVTQKSCRR